MDVARTWAAPGAVVLCMALVACAQPDGNAGEDGGAPRGPAPDTEADADPAELIGVWTVTAAGDADGQVARIAPHELRLSYECGEVTGSWRASHSGLFVAYVSGLSAGCRDLDPPTPAWLRQATSFEADGEARVLVDASGEITARLQPAPEAAPTITEEERDLLFSSAEPVPPDLTPAEPAELVGRWVPAAGSAGDPYVELVAGGGWHGSDGCNGQAGRWVAGARGALLAVSGPTTLMMCPGEPVGSWLAGAARAAFDGEELVLLDAAGGETGRLRRD